MLFDEDLMSSNFFQKGLTKLSGLRISMQVSLSYCQEKRIFLVLNEVLELEILTQR